ncbi:hypothetical protein F5B20DRAFT_34974 [Whalleya microplaca]|nr:hypothetical protein F5B20DRAFT_34974 [Whalleya microplaca]
MPVPQTRADAPELNLAFLEIARAGDLDDDDWTPEAMADWITTRGGTYSEGVDGAVTHLLATQQQWDDRVDRVKKALRNGEGTHIVTRDWLAQSIVNGRRENERDFSLKQPELDANAQWRTAQTTAKAAAEAANFIDTALHRIHRDSTGFRYEVTLRRADEESGAVESIWRLYLFESRARPRLYSFLARFYKTPTAAPLVHRAYDTPRKFEVALAAFKFWFRKKTGLRWDERHLGTNGDADKFRYQLPAAGQPTGIVRPIPPSDFKGTGPATPSVTAPVKLPIPGGAPDDNEDNDDGGKGKGIARGPGGGGGGGDGSSLPPLPDSSSPRRGPGGGGSSSGPGTPETPATSVGNNNTPGSRGGPGGPGGQGPTSAPRNNNNDNNNNGGGSGGVNKRNRDDDDDDDDDDDGDDNGKGKRPRRS